MDFNQFDSVAAGNQGAWLHLASPINGKLLFADTEETQPCRVKVLGAEGSVGQGMLKSAREAMQAPADAKDGAEDPNEVLLSETANLIVGFENVNKGSAPAAAPKDVEWFLALQKVVGGNHKSFAEQVRSFSVERANFLGNALSG